MKRTSSVLIFLFLLLISASAYALTADVTMRVNGALPDGTIQMVPGQDNILEFWITNSAKIKGMSLGFELSNGGQPYNLVRGYGNIPYEEDPETGDQTYDSTLLMEHGTTNNFKNSFGLGNLAFDRGMSTRDTIFFGGVDATVTQTKNIFAHLVSTLAYSVKIHIPEGQTPGLFCVRPIFVPPAGAWMMDAGTNIDSITHVASGSCNPTFQGIPTASAADPGITWDNTPACFGPAGANNPPIAVCHDVTVSANSSCQASASIDNGSSDPDGDPITLVQVPAGPYSLGDTPVMLIVTDDSGDADTCQATVHVVDTTPPTITCPANIVRGNDAGQCGATVTFSVGATDFCTASPTIVSTPPSGSFFPVGMAQVRSIATDAAGNADTCFFNVTINDTEPPIASCNGNVVQDNDPGQCGAIVRFTYSATDHQCPGVTAVAVPDSGTFFPVGVTQVAVIATDAAGLKDTCFFDVTVNDVQAPVVTCPSDIVASVPFGDTSKVVEFTPEVADNCDGATFVATPPSGSEFLLGETVVTVVGTDVHGLADTCQFKVTVQVGANPDFAIDASPDSIVVTEGIPDSLLYTVDLTSIEGYDGPVDLSVTGLPADVVLNFGTTTVNVPGSTTLGGHTGLSTPAGQYDLTIMATEAPSKIAHSTVVRLIVIPCSETPIPVVSQNVFNLEVEEGQNLSDDSLFITNDALCGTLYWLASSDESWVTPDPNQGSVKVGDVPGSMMYLKYSTAVLVPDVYVAHVTVVADKKVSGAVITINLTVTPKPPSTDSILVDNANVYAGGTVAVPVYFNNNEWIGGMSVGLHWDSDNVTLDSVSHAGSRIEYVNFKFATINATNKTVLLGMAVLPPEPFLEPGGGLWATMWFTAGPECPVTVSIDSQYIAPGGEVVFADTLAQLIYPQFVPGSIMVDCPVTECISGTIVDGVGGPIADATVELYTCYPPSGSPLATTTSGPDGSYEFCPAYKNGMFSVRAYKTGYYPAFAEATLPSTDIMLTLVPIEGVITPTWEWVNLYCDLNALFEGSPVLPGSVIEAFDPSGVVCGRWVVSEAGTYGFMPVYRDDPYSPAVDEGCEPGNLITVKVDGYVATMTNGAIYWGENGDRYEACFDVTPVPPTHCLILKQGWNLVSWNIDTPNDDITVLAQDVMDNVDVILSFEMGAQTYDPKLPEFSTLEFADHYHGFWFRMKAEDTLCLEGPTVAASTPINLELNWNLVSYLPLVPYSVPDALLSIEGKYVVVLGYDGAALTYDPAYPGLSNLTEMAPDFGYWIKTTEAATLIYSGVIRAKATVTTGKSDVAPRAALSNTWINLYGSGVKLNGETLPVGTVIEAYDASGTLVGETIVRTAGKFGFMPVYGAETMSGDAVGKSAGSVITLKVDGEIAEQAITWTQNGDRIEVPELTTAKGGILPTSYTLNQNYPNPFNPETSIDYVVAKSGHVELAIYNILGDKIKTLVSGYQAAGSYTVKWQADTDAGTSVASGVYFYKLTAGDFTNTKKMTLLK